MKRTPIRRSRTTATTRWRRWLPLTVVAAMLLSTGAAVFIAPARAWASTTVTLYPDYVSSVDSDTPLPSIGYSPWPTTSSSDWSVQPMCAAYASSDPTFAVPLSGAQPAGQYTT